MISSPRPSAQQWLFIYDGWTLWAKGAMAMAIVGFLWTIGLTAWVSAVQGFKWWFVSLMGLLSVSVFGGLFFGARWFLRSTKMRRAKLEKDERVSRYKRMMDAATSVEDRDFYDRLLQEARLGR